MLSLKILKTMFSVVPLCTPAFRVPDRGVCFSCAAMHPCFQGPRQRGVGGRLLIHSNTSTLFIFIHTARFGNLNATCPELYGQFKGPSGEPGLDTC